jgi:hypothetical protein
VLQAQSLEALPVKKVRQSRQGEQRPAPASLMVELQAWQVQPAWPA